MITSLALVLLATASGTLASYLYDERAAFAARLCAGACLGITTLGLVCFLIASFLGLTPLAILLTVVMLALPVLSLTNPRRRNVVLQDLAKTRAAIYQAISHPSRMPLGYVLFYLLTAAVLWQCFQKAMMELTDGIFTGVLNNFGDLPFHISVITSFVYGNNFQPEDPTYAGAKFTYPFLDDFVSAIFVRCGASLRQAMFIENFVVALAFVGLIHRWALVMLRDRLAAVVAPLLVILNGGLGWILFLQRASEANTSFGAFLKSLPASFTVIPDTTWRWGNAVSSLLIPQRGFLLGLPLALIVFTQWWLAGDNDDDGKQLKKEKGKAARSKKRSKSSKAQDSPALFPDGRISLPVRRMIAAGIVAGLLPLVHAHSFVVVMTVGAGVALLQRRWRAWFAFFAVASVIALPQMFWSTHNSAVDAAKFFEWQFGWDRGKENALWFWLKNSGLFIPLTILAILWKNTKPLVSRRLLLFSLPFALCFIVPNVLKMAPWIWDNIKVLFYWWLASAPLVALLLAHLWRQELAKKIIAAILFACVTVAGALDVASIIFRPTKHQVFDAQGIRFSELIKQQTPPRALVMHAPVHNHPVFLTGRRSLMGYPGHIWTHGLEYLQRESEIKRVYAGVPDAEFTLAKYGVNYVVVGPHERGLMNVNDRFFAKFELLGEVGEYRLFRITQR